MVTSSSLPRFDRYEPLFRIAAGGMAEVFAARIRGEGGFEKLVAIKRMLPHLVDDEAFVNMFLDEARLAVHVASPHVVQTLDLGRADDGALFIVMELVIGASLATLTREARRGRVRMPPAIVLELLAQGAQGLDDAHEAVTPGGVGLEIVHRDVSPHNLLIGLDGRARVSDFGIARALLRRTSTGAGELKGKVAYFSPEQAEGQQVDRRSDVFALGVVAWECLANRRLFGGGEMLEVLSQVRQQPIAPLHELDPSLPVAVSEAVARALARPLDERYPTAHAFAAALREAARELGPTPAPRAIGAWVAATAPEAVGDLRARLDAAQCDPDGVTIARDPSGSNRVVAAGSPPASSPALPPATTTPALHHDSTSPTLGSSVMTSPGAAAEATAPAPGVGRAAALGVLGALVIVAGVGVIASGRLSSGPAPAASGAAREAAPAATSAPVVTAVAPSASAPAASAPAAVSARAPAVASGAAPARTARTRGEPAAKPAATAAPAAERPKGPTGPLLGDDAFK